MMCICGNTTEQASHRQNPCAYFYMQIKSLTIFFDQSENSSSLVADSGGGAPVLPPEFWKQKINTLKPPLAITSTK